MASHRASRAQTRRKLSLQGGRESGKSLEPEVWCVRNLVGWPQNSRQRVNLSVRGLCCSSNTCAGSGLSPERVLRGLRHPSHGLSTTRRCGTLVDTCSEYNGMWISFLVAAGRRIRAGSASVKTRLMRAFRFTAFLCASSTIADPTVRMSKFLIWKYCFFPKSGSLTDLLLSLQGTSRQAAPNNHNKSKCVAPAHNEHLLAAKSGKVKEPTKQVLILKAADYMGSSHSNWQIVPHTMAVWFHEAMSVLLRSPHSTRHGSWSTRRCSSLRSWSTVSLMYIGLPSETLTMKFRKLYGTRFSGTDNAITAKGWHSPTGSRKQQVPFSYNCHPIPCTFGRVFYAPPGVARVELDDSIQE